MTSQSTAAPGDFSSPLPGSQTSGDRLWSVLCHLSFFFGLALLSFVFPLIVYLVMRSSSSAYAAHHAREALNFHLSVLLYILCCAPLCIILIGIPALAAVVLTGIVCSIVAAVRAAEGVYYEYPMTIRFFR
ncbi:MAG TPA: DUF4870 domain-containing protein [Opitutaceae bacterium]|jgi:hypothetical protein